MKDPLDGLDRDKGYPFDTRDSDIRESGGKSTAESRGQADSRDSDIRESGASRDKLYPFIYPSKQKKKDPLTFTSFRLM